MALWYTVGFSAAIVLVVKLIPAPGPGQPDKLAWASAAVSHTPTFLAVAALSFVCMTLLRYLLLSLFNPRR